MSEKQISPFQTICNIQKEQARNYTKRKAEGIAKGKEIFLHQDSRIEIKALVADPAAREAVINPKDLKNVNPKRARITKRFGNYEK